MIDRKSKVLEVATKLFAERGFENTSVAQICEQAQVSKGLLYHHFQSKDEVLIAIFNRNTEAMVAHNETLMSQPPRERLLSLIDSIFSQLERDKMYFQLNLNIMFQPSTQGLLKKQIHERSANLLSFIHSIFLDLVPQQSKLLSYLFIAEIDGVALDYLTVFEEYPLAEIKSFLINKYQSI